MSVPRLKLLHRALAILTVDNGPAAANSFEIGLGVCLHYELTLVFDLRNAFILAQRIPLNFPLEPDAFRVEGVQFEDPRS